MTRSRRGRGLKSSPSLSGGKPNKEPSVRFVESNDGIVGNPTFVIADTKWWTANEEELAYWLLENTERGLNTREGMILTFASDEEAMWFKLRWF